MHDIEKLMAAAKIGDLQSVAALVEADASIVNQRDKSGATAVHYAALNGHPAVVQALVARGADINSVDTQVHATPTGWAIEYLRELGGYLAIELDDLAYAIQIGDVQWTARFLQRFPSLREARDTRGIPFQELARRSGNAAIARLFQRASPTR